MKNTELNLLENKKVIQWCYEGITNISLKNTTNKDKLKYSKAEETKWGNSVIRANSGNQWTTILCQEVVREALIILGRKNVHKVKTIKSSIRNKEYKPDLECDEYVYEVKGRSWCTTGTAGEKVLGVPLKYGELPNLYRKPLKIVLVGYQEYEVREHFAFGDLLDSNNQTKELNESLEYFRKHNIEYIGFTDILKQLGLNYGCWNN